MATIGKQLSLPEYGWKRIDSADAKIQSNTAASADSNSYGGSYYCLFHQDEYVRFNFTGTKLRLICLLQVGTAQGTASQGGEALVTLDGEIVGTFNTQGAVGETLVYQTLNYERLDLENTEHSIVISNPTGGHYIWFDAVDIGVYDSVHAYDPEHTEYKIDQAARAVLAKAKVRGSKFGCTYRFAAAAAGSFGPLEAAETEGTLVEHDDGSRTQPFNFVFVGYAPDGSLKFVADRNLQDTTWETLNSAGYCTAYGAYSAFDEYAPRFRYRLPHSGLVEGSPGEWEALVVEHAFDETLADPAAYWHTSAPSWTLNVAPEAAANRVVRGGAAADACSSLASTGTAGFRPVLLLNPIAKIVHRPDAETVCPLPMVNNVKDILPGQAISCEYTTGANAFGQFTRLGRAQKPLLSDLAPERPDGSFHFICVGYTPSGAKKLVADRNIQGKISWETLNAAGLATVSGAALNIDGVDGLSMRLPGSLADHHVNAEKHGEWDAILSYRDFDGSIAPSDNAVWNCLSTQSWTLAVPSTVDDAGTPADPALRIARGGQDKDQLALRQCTYASSSINERVGFRPVLIVKDDSRFLYLKESDNSCYVLTEEGEAASLEKVVENWAALSDEAKREAFLAYGMGMLTQPEKLKVLGKCRILAYSLSPAGKATAGFSAVPQDQLVRQKGLFSLETFKRLDKVALTSALQAEGVCTVLVTLDHKEYLTYDFELKVWKAADPSNLKAVRAHGIAPERLEEIDTAAWRTLTKGKSGLGFAYLVALDKTTDRCDVDRLALTVDVKGVWKKL